MYRANRFIHTAWLTALGLSLTFAATGARADDDPPDRVARVSYLRGDVSFEPAGTEEWVQATLNRPLVTGDRLYTDRDSRVEMDIGAATVRMDEGTSFNLLNLDDNIAQVELTEGVLRLHVRHVFEGQSYEVDTPTLAFVITDPGEYRVDIAPNGDSTMVTVFDGSGDVYGENNASYSVRQGQAYRFYDSSLRDYEVLDLPRPDDFDRWVDSRDRRYEQSVSRRYVSEEVIGYSDLDEYGGWNDVADYGPVWYPTNVAVGWAPYRYGHWAWIDPWGWTWVDNAPWGFAPFHYGRWVYAGNRWGWCPGPRQVRPVYAPALVAFVGGSGWSVGISVGGGGPVGWFPLGPRDVYVPWYHSSRRYFTEVNVRNTTIVNNTYITNVYNDYSSGRAIRNVNYAYQRNTSAVTAVPRNVFVGARPIGDARVKVNERQLRTATVASRVGIAPDRASFVASNAGRARVTPQAKTLDRRVIARTAPPPRTASVATRIEAIKRNDGRPLATPEIRRIAPRTAATGNRAAPERVQVVGRGAAAKPQPLPARGTREASKMATPERGAPTRGPATTAPNTRTQPARGNVPERSAPNREQPANRSTLPSERFAPHRGQTTPSATPRSNPVREPTPRTTERATPSRSQPARSQPEPANRNRAEPERKQSTPSYAPRSRSEAPARQTAPVERRSSPTPTRRTPEPQQRTQAPRVERSTPPAQRREAPRVERSTPQQYQPRSAPAPERRSAPVPQAQPRSAPPVRQAPQQERRAPPPKERSREDKKEKDDNNGRH